MDKSDGTTLLAQNTKLANIKLMSDEDLPGTMSLTAPHFVNY